jgi:hypothetical protein
MRKGNYGSLNSNFPSSLYPQLYNSSYIQSVIYENKMSNKSGTMQELTSGVQRGREIMVPPTLISLPRCTSSCIIRVMYSL